MEAHSRSAVSRGSVSLPEWTEFQSGMLDWWRQLPAQWWMAVWMGGMKEDCDEKSIRSLHWRHYYTERREAAPG